MANSFLDKVYIVPGEALAYPRGTSTPPGPAPTYLEVSSEIKTLDPNDPASVAMVNRWFVQSITPLVGEEAAKMLPLPPEFLAAAIRFRISLAEGPAQSS